MQTASSLARGTSQAFEIDNMWHHCRRSKVEISLKSWDDGDLFDRLHKRRQENPIQETQAKSPVLVMHHNVLRGAHVADGLK